MKALFKALAGVVIAASTSLVAAQPIQLNFNDLSGSGYFNDAPLSSSYTVSGFTFDFSSANGTPNTAWYWAPGGPAPSYQSGDGPVGNANITGYWNAISPAAPPVGQYDAFVISSPVAFSVQSAKFSGCCGPIWVAGTPFGAATDGTADVALFSSWDPLTLDFSNAATAASLLTPGGLDSKVNANQTFLSQIVFWAPAGLFAIDDINVTMVPEPSSYAMMIAGLGALVFVARRRKAKDATAA